MTEPTEIDALIAEARKTADRIRNVIGPSDRYADMIDNLADALEAVTAERDGLRIELSQANAIIAGEFYTIPMNVGDALARTSRIPEHPKED